MPRSMPGSTQRRIGQPGTGAVAWPDGRRAAGWLRLDDRRRCGRALATLPDSAFRLAIVLTAPEPARVGRLVERGGIVALEVIGAVEPDLPGRLGSAGLRIQEVATAPEGRTRLICRREDG